VIDILLFKGQAEAHELMAHYTQRHHLVRGRGAAVSRPTAGGRLGWSWLGTRKELAACAHALLSVCLALASLQITRYVATDAAGGPMAESSVGARRSAFLAKFLKSNTTE
jgi:hypothetical protein